MIEYELIGWNDDKVVVGIDEAGRGPLAGPLVVASVVLPLNYHHDEIYDSKALTAKKREKLFLEIIESAIEIQVDIIHEKTIDDKNIYQATKESMMNLATSSVASIVLLDAMKIDSDKQCFSIIKGDQKSMSIAAASIVAKVIRDDIMLRYDTCFPLYGFKDHKGYPTKKHIEAIMEFGILEIHRKTYKPISTMK